MTTKPVTVPGFIALKGDVPIVMCTAYDYPSAMLADAAGVDAILVGDSVNMVVHGEPNTLTATMDMMVMHTRAVSKAVSRALVVADMPFLSATTSIPDAVRNAGRLITEGGASAVKVERGEGVQDAVAAILRADIPVMGHVGLTPQSVMQMGGYKLQGKTATAADSIMLEATQLEELGCFSVVLECIPSQLAQHITERLSIPTIGIGAGVLCDGQVLVWHDMLGFNEGYAPRHSRRFINLADIIGKAMAEYVSAVRTREFPGDAETTS